MTICAQCGIDADHTIPPYYGAEPICGPCAQANAAMFDREGWPKPIWDYPAKSAAVAGRHFGAFVVIWPGGTKVWKEGHTLEDLEAGARAHGVRQLWIHESALEPLGLASEHPRRRYEERVEAESPWRSRGGLEVSIPAWHGHTDTHDGVYRNSSPWYGTPSPLDLFRQLAAFEATVGHRWVSSGAITSEAMLSDHWKGKIKAAELPGEWALEAIELPDISVDRELLVTLEAKKWRWCYGFDLNANYLGAASNLRLPVGPYQEAHLPVSELGNYPGYWPTEDGYRTTVGLGSTVILRRDDPGYYYPESHQFLQPWYRALRDARAALPKGPALSAVKDTYQKGVGRLISHRRAPSAYAQRMRQPYWQQSVVASARERLRRRITEMKQAPVAVDTDAVFFVSDRESPEIAAALIGLRLGDGLGEWHAQGRCRGAEALAILTNPDDTEALKELRAAIKQGRTDT